MHYVTVVRYDSGYALLLTFDDNTVRRADLEPHLDGEVFEPLRDPAHFRTAHLNKDIDTVVWDSGADMSPDFLFDGTAYVAPVELGAGNWNIRMKAQAADGTEFTQRVVLHVKR